MSSVAGGVCRAVENIICLCTCTRVQPWNSAAALVGWDFAQTAPAGGGTGRLPRRSTYPSGTTLLVCTMYVGVATEARRKRKQ